MQRLDLSGQRFGRLVAVRRENRASHISFWVCQCDCGGQASVRLGNLRNGHTTSCGCAKHEMEHSLSHGHDRVGRRTRTLRCWSGAKTRCFNTKNPNYPRWGGRGITMCDEWRDSFAAFLRDMGECPEGKSLDRIDNDGNYEPGNCRWATLGEQAANKRNNVLVPLGGKRVTLREFSRAKGINYHSLHALMRHHGQPADVIARRMIERRGDKQN